MIETVNFLWNARLQVRENKLQRAKFAELFSLVNAGANGGYWHVRALQVFPARDRVVMRWRWNRAVGH